MREKNERRVRWKDNVRVRENVKNPPLDQHHIFGKLKNEMKFIVLGGEN